MGRERESERERAGGRETDQGEAGLLGEEAVSRRREVRAWAEGSGGSGGLQGKLEEGPVMWGGGGGRGEGGRGK